MYYYVTYDDVEDGIFVHKFETEELAIGFITETMSNNFSAEVENFEVFYGVPVNLKRKIVRTVTLEVVK